MPNAHNDDVIAQIRNLMVPYWCSSESGGAYLSAAGYDEAENIENYKILLSFFPEIDPASDDKFYFLAEKVVRLIKPFFLNYRLAPGIYSIPNNLRRLVENGEALLDMSGRPSTTVPLDERIEFTLTQDHITLIRQMNTRTYEDCIEIMDFKRPYGDCSYYYIDMATALDEPILKNPEGKVFFTLETEERYYKLHTEMLFAIQAFWSYATLPNS